LGALLQGLYAHVGVTDFWRIHRRTSEDLLADIEFVRWRTQVERATAEVAASGLLNRHGQIFLEAIAATVSEWRDEAIPKKARQIADDAAMSHRVSWCVRNLVPRSEELSGIKSRWLSGQTSGVVSSSLHRDKRDVPAHHRSRLPASYLEVLNSARQSPDAGTQIDVPPGDMSYARGDFDQALAEYLHELEADPLHPQPWAGIALTVQHLVDGEHKSCLVHRADLVAHLFALLRSEDPNIDIVKLIAWLSDSTDGE
jgi:hypothetical protein